MSNTALVPAVSDPDVTGTAGAIESEVRDFWALLKPRVMTLVVFTGFVGMTLAPGGLHPLLAGIAILCIAVGAGAAGAINMWYERDIDALMTRTRNRPIPAGRMEPDGMDAPYYGVMCARMGFGFELQTEGASTMDITTIGFDLAKTVFQVHGADGEGRPVLRRKLRRGKVLAFFAGLPSCLVGMEACASAHYWARELQALGHEVRLIPPQYVRPFVKTNKNDAADAEAICEAVTRPTMRFAPAKSAEQQSVLMLHRARELLVRQRTMVINALRGHCAEFGLIVAQGASKVEELVAIIEDPGDVRLPPLAREALGSLVEQLRSAQARIKQLEATLLAWHRSNQASRRLATIPGVGVITATALVATIGDGAQFRSGRQLSAWLGLVPRQHSSGGKDRLGRISKRGDGYIRRLLVHGARTVLRWRRAKPDTHPGWTDRLLERRPTNIVLVAMANKTARVAWALLRYERIYQPMPA